MSATRAARGPPAALAACLALLLATAPRAAGAACSASAPFNASSFRVSLKSSGAFSDARTREPWRRYCFELSKAVVRSGGGDYSGSLDTCASAEPRCAPDRDSCCTSESHGPAGLASISVFAEPGCARRGSAAGDAMSKGWWSFGPRGSRADARLAKSRAKPALRPSFEVTLRPGEADAWTAVELCLHLWDHADNPCRTIGQLCGEGGCRVTAVTTKFAQDFGGAKTRTCCLDGSLPLAPITRPSVCNPACQNGGACVADNRCNCSGTGFTGTTCAEPWVCSPACQNGGACVAAENHCNCSGTGFTGATCSEPPVCNPACQNGGACVADSRCNCSGTGFTGTTCAEPWVCSPACQNGGACVAAENHCNCSGTGFTGATCSEPPVCNPACQNGGACVADSRCNCSGTGFTGTTCAEPWVCSPACQNGGACVAAENHCNCSGTGFTGATCSEPPVCNPACQNGGACVADNRCNCSGTGFTGTTCAEPWVCSPACQNSGACVAAENHCNCSGTGFTGATCSKPPVCNPACQNGGVCVADNRCNCSGTGFAGATCATTTVPHPVALWTFDECAGRSTPDATGGTGSHAWVGPGVSYERCGGAAAAARGCAVKFSSANCCDTGEPYYRQCNGSLTWCDDFDRGAVVTINGPPAPSGGPLPLASALVFDGFKSLTVSAWVRIGIVKVATVVGRLYGEDQFVLGIGVGGTWDYSRTVVFMVCLDGCPQDMPCDFQCFHVVGEQVPLGAWAHLVGVFGGGSLRVYLDGRPSGAPLLLPAPYGAAGLSARGLAPIYAGGHPSWGILDGGSIDCLSFWGEELSAGQVRALHLESRETCGCPADGAAAP